MPVEAASCQRVRGIADRATLEMLREIDHRSQTDIIVGRDSSAERENQTVPEAIDRGWILVRAGRDGARLCRGLRRVPLSCRGESATVRTNHDHQLRCGGAEKRQDRIPLQSPGSANLRQRTVPACGIRSLLVLAAAYRAADEHLKRTLETTADGGKAERIQWQEVAGGLPGLG